MSAPSDITSAPGPEPAVTTAQSPGRRVLRIRGTSWLVRPRMLIAGIAMTALVLLLFLLSVGISDYPIGPIDVARILLGGGTRIENVVVFDSALPRALVSTLVGFGLALSGSLTQLIARNPLATPDILGITAGASALAMGAIAFGSSWGAALANLGIATSALIGGLATAVVMYLLAWPGRRSGGVDPMRMILIGVGMTWMLQALTGYLLTRANISDVGRAQMWIVGSVSMASWKSVWPAAIAVIGGVIVVTVLARQISALTLGTDLARGLGVDTAKVTTTILVTAVIVAALSVAAAGPIAFVALLAPQIAMRVAGSAVPTPLMSGLFGAALVLGGDILCRTVLPGSLPVGIVTAALGGPFLIYLMIRMSRRATV